MIPIEALRPLADNGQPLDLTVEQLSHHHYSLNAQERGTFELTHYYDLTHLLEQLRSDLQHYPNPVTINGDTIVTTPFPDLASVTVTTHQHHSTHLADTQTLMIEEGYSHYHRQNFFIAGILFSTSLPGTPHTYLTPGRNRYTHWQPAHQVTLTPISVVTAEDLSSLTDVELQLLTQRNNILPFTQTLATRDANQVARTMKHHKAPKEYKGTTYRYALAHPDGDQNADPFSTGELIIVHRTPVAISPKDLNNPEFISLAEALYTTEQEFVPVSQDAQPNHVITDIVLEQNPPRPARPVTVLQPVESITLNLGFNRNPPSHTVHPQFWMTFDEDFDNIDHVFIAPGPLKWITFLTASSGRTGKTLIQAAVPTTTTS